MRGEGPELLKGLNAYDGVRVGFGARREDGAEGEVVDGLVCALGELSGVVGGEAELGLRAEDAAGGGRREIVLTDMETEAEQGGEVGAVVEDEVCTDASAGVEVFCKIPIKGAFVADLDPFQVGAGLDRVGQSMPVACEQRGIEDRVKGHLLLSGGLVVGIGPGGDLETAADPA